MTLKCDLSTTPCEHLFHTICIKNISQNLEIPAGQGYFDMAQNPLILTLLARKMVCYYCREYTIQLFKTSFKTADEINNFAKKMKKIDQNASYSSNKNKEFENNFRELSLENFSKDIFLRSPEIDLINRPWPWINGPAQAFQVQEGYAHDNSESIDSKENCKTFEEDTLNMKVSNDLAQSPNGAKLEVNESSNFGFVEMKSYAQARHDHAFKVQEGYVHDNFDYIDSKGNFRTFEEDILNILNMKVSDDVVQSPNGAKLEVNISLNSGFVEMKSYAHVTKQTTPMQATATPKQAQATPEQAQATPEQAQVTPKQAQVTPKQAQATPKPTNVRHDMPKHAKSRKNWKKLEKEDHQMKFNKRKPKRQPA